VSSSRVDSPQLLIPEKLLYRTVQRFRVGLGFKAHRLWYHSNLGLGVITKKKKKKEEEEEEEEHEEEDEIEPDIASTSSLLLSSLELSDTHSL